MGTVEVSKAHPKAARNGAAAVGSGVEVSVAPVSDTWSKAMLKRAKPAPSRSATTLGHHLCYQAEPLVS
jgi:hypothetical protein